MAYMRTPDYIYAGGDDDAIYLSINGQDIVFAAAQELAVMLVAEMTDVEREAVEARACEKWGGNIGCDALLHKRGLPGFDARVAAILAEKGREGTKVREREETNGR